MFNDISYKMDINDIKEKILRNYTKVIYNYIKLGEYSKKRRQRSIKIFLYSGIFLFINFLMYTYIAPYLKASPRDYLIFDLMISIMSIIFIICIICWQNSRFKHDIKKQCIQGILQDLADIKYVDNKESQNIPDIMTDKDIQNMKISEYFIMRQADDTFVGRYDNIDYNLQELKLYTNAKGNQISYEGTILKAKVHTNISGWIDVRTKGYTKKTPFTTYEYLTTIYIIFGIFIVLFRRFISSMPNSIYIYSGLFILASIISYFLTKYRHRKKANTEKQNIKNSNTSSTDKKVTIKKTANIEDTGNIITDEFVELIDKLKILFDTTQICCKLYSDKVILAINSHENMFELGNLFIPPTNEKIADRFISQIAGILLFLDYLATNINNQNT